MLIYNNWKTISSTLIVKENKAVIDNINTCMVRQSNILSGLNKFFYRRNNCDKVQTYRSGNIAFLTSSTKPFQFQQAILAIIIVMLCVISRSQRCICEQLDGLFCFSIILTIRHVLDISRFVENRRGEDLLLLICKIIV